MLSQDQTLTLSHATMARALKHRSDGGVHELYTMYNNSMFDRNVRNTN